MVKLSQAEKQAIKAKNGAANAAKQAAGGSHLVNTALKDFSKLSVSDMRAKYNAQKA